MNLEKYAVNYTCTDFHGIKWSLEARNKKISKWSLLNTEKEVKDIWLDFLKILLESYNAYS